MPASPEITVLFADDDLYNMRPTIEALQARKVKVEEVIDGSGVLRRLRQKKGPNIDVVILDIMMDEGEEMPKTQDGGRSTGWVVYGIIRKDLCPDIPIVVSTVVSDPEILDTFNLTEDPMLRILFKPYRFSDLWRNIASLLDFKEGPP